MDISDFVASTKKQLFKEKAEVAERTASAAAEELAEATPVDTGEAKEGWSFEVKGAVATISNPVDHLKYLNAGSSDQAPANFIENTVLKYGEPVGSIVTYT